MKPLNLGKLITPSAVTELDGAPARLLAFAHHLTSHRRAAFVAAGPLAARESRLLAHLAPDRSYAAPTTAAARWHINAVLACRQADVLVALVTAPDSADRTSFTQWLESEARRTGCAMLLLRRDEDAHLPSPARQRFLLTTDDFFLTTEYQLTPAGIGMPAVEAYPVAEFEREFILPDASAWLTATAAKTGKFLASLLEPVFRVA